MANNNNEDAENNLDSSKDSGLDKSFVGKFVTGILNNTPLSKWFGKESTFRTAVRRREDDDEEDDASYIFQPPVKRAKLPSTPERNNYSAHVFESPVTVHNSSNNVSTKVFGRFPEPVAGPSGIKSRKLFEKHNTGTSTITVSNSFDSQDVVNGDDDSDSEVSTSGYSSAPKTASQKKNEQGVSTTTDTSGKPSLKSRSLFTTSSGQSSGRSLFAERSPSMNTSLSSRRPAFNASTFGSPDFVDRTLSTKRILNSPFYSGNTIYGGASAYTRKSRRNAETSNNNNARVSVQIKPVNENSSNDNTTLSKTARRILSTLEQYSTPISDAKKIPVAPNKQGILSKYIGATPYLTRERRRAPTKELQVPTVPELIQMKQKERLQHSTESVRQIATTSKSTLNKEEYKLRTEDDNNKQKHSNKMKNNVISVRQPVRPLELVSEVKLPKVSLPITTLPKFDFVMMTSQSSSEVQTISTTTKPQTATVSNPAPVVQLKKQDEKKILENGKIGHFVFSEPLIISKDPRPVSAINCFKFSEPLCKRQLDNFKACDKNPFKTKNNGENAVKPATVTGSVADVSGKKDDSLQTKIKDKPEERVARDEPKSRVQESKGFGEQFKLSSDKWECGSCMVRNDNSADKCVACAGAKPQSGFGDRFKAPVSTWECTSCLIRNKNEAEKCAACGVSKSQKAPAANWGDKFKPSSDTWECSSCMIRNKNELVKCQACETPKSGKGTSQKTFVSTFKPPADTWECPTCMIRNKNEIAKCLACETVKPGPKFSFGIKVPEWECKSCLVRNKNDLTKCTACGLPKGGENKGFGGVFKAKEGEWDCSSCMVRNKSGVDVCACCGLTKPGSSSGKLSEAEKKPVIGFNFGIDKASPVQFKFGIPPTTTTSTKSEETKQESSVVGVVSSSAPASSFVFAKTPSTSTTSGGFSFGVTSQEKDAPAKTITSTSDTVAPAVATNPLLKPTEKLPEKATPAPVGFKFGLDNSLVSQKNVVSQTTSVIGSDNLVTSTSKTETPVFSSSFETAKSVMPAPTFQFKQAAAINGDISKPNKDTPMFGVKPADGNNMFANTAMPASFKFAPKPTKAEESAPIFKFGGSDAAGAGAKRTFGESGESVSNGFGSVSKIPAFGSAKPFSFGAADSAPKSASSFSFGQSEKPAAPVAASANPVFSFGSGAATAAAAATSPPPPSSSGFNYFSSGTSGGFNFGAKAETAQAFGAPTPAAAPNVFGSAGGGASKNGSFNFGNSPNNNNQKAIFSFGASQTTNNQPSFGTPTQSGFNFGAPAPPTVPTGGFSFTGAQPSFNFTDGSAPGAPPPRKIKKAFRRTHR